MTLIIDSPRTCEQYHLGDLNTWRAKETELWGKVYDNMLAAVEGREKPNRALNVEWLEARYERLMMEYRPAEALDTAEWICHIKRERE